MRLIIGTLLLIALVTCGVVAQKNPSAWKEFTSKEGQFTVSFPGTPTAIVDTIDTSAGRSRIHIFTLQADPLFYYISYIDVPKSPQTREEHKAALDADRDRAVAKRRLISESEITFDGIVGRELLLESAIQIAKGRFFYAKNRVYHLIVSAAPDVAFRNGKTSANAADLTELYEASSKRFFDSFKFTKALPGKPSSTVKVEDLTTTVGKIFKSTEGRFTVVFPGNPKVEETTIDTPLGPLKTHSAVLQRAESGYYVSYTDSLPGSKFPSEDKETLNGIRDEFIEDGHRLISESDVTVAGIAGREWLFEGDVQITRARAFYFKQRLYQIMFHARLARAFRNGKSSPNPADRTEFFETTSLAFFDSFKLTK